MISVNMRLLFCQSSIAVITIVYSLIANLIPSKMSTMPLGDRYLGDITLRWEDIAMKMRNWTIIGATLIGVSFFAVSGSNDRPYDAPSGPKHTSQLLEADESESGIEGLLEKGESALEAGDRESARIAFEKAAELGSAEAHFALAYKFRNSPERLAYHFAEAAKRGHHVKEEVAQLPKASRM